MYTDEGTGPWLIETIANHFGVPAKISAIEDKIYRVTDCGAFIEFDEFGVKVGTIVEGGDATFEERVEISDLLDMAQEDSDRQLIRRLMSALNNCENFVNELEFS